MYTIYQHYKGMLYLHLGTAAHSESLEPHEVYRCLYDNSASNTWIRPKDMFHESLTSGTERFAPIGRFRRVVPQEEGRIIAFGFDVWGEGRSLERYIADSVELGLEQRAERFVFEGMDGEPRSKLSVIRFARSVVGLASLATQPALRGKGYGETVLRSAMEVVRLEDPDTRFLLFSEISPQMYERHGFRVVDESLQKFKPSLAMATGASPLRPEEALYLERYF